MSAFQIIYAPASRSVANSAAEQIDPDLKIAAAANTTYFVQARIIYRVNSSPATTSQFGFYGPTGSTAEFLHGSSGATDWVYTETNLPGDNAINDYAEAWNPGFNVFAVWNGIAYITTDSTAGDVGFHWRCTTSQNGFNYVNNGSWIIIEEVA